MQRVLEFEKDPDNRWYVVLPEWTGERDELEMVAGADIMCDLIAQGGQKIWLTIATEPFAGCDTLEWIDEQHQESFGGANYLLKEYKKQEYNLPIWLCPVTEFVCGSMPKTIYIF